MPELPELSELPGLLAGDALITAIGLGGFLISFIAIALAEVLWPARRGQPGAGGRIGVNFGLGLFNLALVTLVPLSSLAAAALAAENGWGLLQLAEVPFAASLALLIVARTLMGYWLHRAYHRVPFLWPMHAVHHRDDALDLSTTFRSHPFQYLLSSACNFVLVLAMGPPVLAALVTDMVMLAGGLLHHANLRLPDRLSARLEPWLITPRLHLVHHARERALHDSNYGDLFSVWDRLFGTYRAAPAEGFMIGVPRAGAVTADSVSK